MNVQFGEFRLDSDTRQLLRASSEVHLSPKAFELLRMLVEHRPKAMSKAELSEQLWPATFVSEANLSVLIAEIRGVLREPARNPTFVRTVQRFGYAFSGSAVDLPASSPTGGSDARRCLLMVGTRQFALAEGENILGRDPGAGVWIDLPGISRRHARVVVADGQATIDDLESKNGTYVRDERLASPAMLNDGDEIRVGSAVLTFRVWSPARTTDTSPLPS